MTIKAELPKIKQKHYWLYPLTAGYGKSYFLQRLCRKYNGFIILDMDNACGIPRGIQLLCFNEVGTTNKLEWNVLKRIASGNANSRSLKKKNIRAFVQAQKRCSNHHSRQPFAVRGVRNLERQKTTPFVGNTSVNRWYVISRLTLGAFGRLVRALFFGEQAMMLASSLSLLE